MDWTKVRLHDPWRVSQDEGGFTVRAGFYARSLADLPQRGDRLCGDASSVNCAPEGFRDYRVASVESAALTPVGPYIADVTARACLSSSLGSVGKSLTTQASFTMELAEETIPRDACRRCALYRRPPHIDFADAKVLMMSVTTSHYVTRRNLIGSWGTFAGVIPWHSFPKWLRDLPGGDNRWRLVGESMEQTLATNGRTVVYHIRRTLRGIPNSFYDYRRERMQWNQDTIGQRDWDDI